MRVFASASQLTRFEKSPVRHEQRNRSRNFEGEDARGNTLLARHAKTPTLYPTEDDRKGAIGRGGVVY